MTWQEVCETALEYFEENSNDFIISIEELDSWDGFLGDERRNYMDSIDDYFYDSSVKDIMRAALNGEDYQYSHFDPEREYFYWDWNTLVSTDDRSYDNWLDDYFIQRLYRQYIELKLRNNNFYGIPEVISELFDSYYEEKGED